MAALLEGLDGRGAHAQGGAVGIGQVRVGRLQVAQLPLQSVVLGIGDHGLIQHVVPVPVHPHLVGQLLHPGSEIHHFTFDRYRMPMMRPRARKKLRVLLPPALKKGSTMPLLGRAPATMPTFTSRCRAKMPAAPAQK